jgi:SSS family solute:Na+ symporter
VSASLIALTVICAIIGAGSFVGFYAGRRYKMDLEQWTVGNRGLGMLLVWVLMAGETYTTFTFLGASGRAYSWGAPVLYILAYQPLIFVVSFYILPQMWEAGKNTGYRHRPISFGCGTEASISKLSWRWLVSFF